MKEKEVERNFHKLTAIFLFDSILIFLLSDETTKVFE